MKKRANGRYPPLNDDVGFSLMLSKRRNEWPLSALCEGQLRVVLCRSWLRNVLVKSDAIGGQIGCK